MIFNLKSKLRAAKTGRNPVLADLVISSVKNAGHKIGSINLNNGAQFTVPDNNGQVSSYKKFTEDLGAAFAEPQYFSIIHSQWLAGSPDVLSGPNKVVLDRTRAIKYFGDWKMAVGRTIRMDNLLNLEVAGVVEDALPNTDFPLKIFISYITWKNNGALYNYVNDWHSISSNHQVFIQTPPSATAASIDRQLTDISIKTYDGKKKVNKFLFLEPLSLLHFDTPRFGSTVGDHLTAKTTLTTLLLIAGLIVIMASINFINLSTAQSVSRSKEVVIRKVLGSDRK